MKYVAFQYSVCFTKNVHSCQYFPSILPLAYSWQVGELHTLSSAHKKPHSLYYADCKFFKKKQFTVLLCRKHNQIQQKMKIWNVSLVHFQQSCFSHLAAQGTSLTAHRKSPPSNQLWEVSQPTWSQDFARPSDTFVKNSVICGERTRYQRAWSRIWIDTAQTFSCPPVNLEQYDHPGFGQGHRSMRSQPCSLAAVTMTILAVAGDTITSYVSNMISTGTAFCHYHFSLLQVELHSQQEKQSWIHCEYSCTRWQ